MAKFDLRKQTGPLRQTYGSAAMSPIMKLPTANRLLVALKKNIPAVLLLGALSLALTPAAQAQITLNFTYNGSGVTLDWNVAAGSFATLTPGGTVGTSTEYVVYHGGLAAESGTMQTLSNPGYSNTAWSSLTGATTHSGDNIAFYGDRTNVNVPVGFNLTTGTLAGQLTWSSTSLINLGFASDATNSGSFAAMGTTVNWSATNTAIPEPSTYAALFGLATLGFAAVRRRLRRG
jgi:hypothetical protein